MKKVLKAVIFDFDGVLCSDFFYNTLETIDNELYEKINKEIFKQSKELIRSWMRGEVSSDKINSLIAEKYKISKEIIKKEFVESIKSMRINAHLMQFAKDLKKTGVKTAIMTDNMDAFDDLVVANFKLQNYFNPIYSSSKIGRLKEDENWKTIHDILKELNCSIEEVLFVDDWEKIGEYIESLNGNFYLYQRGNREIDYRKFRKWFDDNFDANNFNQNHQKKVLVFAPHPDDEILGCGGSIIKAIDKGHEVYLCFLSMGEFGSPIHTPKELKAIIKEEALLTGEFLGINSSNIIFLEIADNQICRYDIDAFKKIIKLIRKIKPNIVYMPHDSDLSNDHIETHHLVNRALWMSGSNNFLEKDESAWWVDNVLGFEICAPMSTYQYAEDLTKEIMNKKIEALKIYNSQARSSGNASNFIGEGAIHLSAYRAAMSIGSYREVFQVIRTNNIL